MLKSLVDYCAVGERTRLVKLLMSAFYAANMFFLQLHISQTVKIKPVATYYALINKVIVNSRILGNNVMYLKHSIPLITLVF